MLGVINSTTWFTPFRLLLTFCAIGMLIYIDRGALSSTAVNGSGPSKEHPHGTGIQGAFSLSLFQEGLLSSAFMVGLLIASPIFAETAKHRNAFRLMGIGLAVWVIAILTCGVSLNYTMLILARMVVGVGEASFVVLAAPFIDDNAPPEQKSLWLGLFNMFIPVGYAIGYIVGGVIGSQLGWRSVFFFEAAIMFPFVVFSFLIQPIDIVRGVEPEKQGSVKEALIVFIQDVRILFSQPVYVMTVITYSLQTGVYGVYAFWGPRACMAVFDLVGNTSDTILGIVTVVTGIGGTILGGIVLDKIGATIRNATFLTMIVLFVGFVLVFVSFLLSYSIYLFVPLFSLGQASIFTANAPVTVLQLWTVPVILRPLACSIMTVCVHAFGDVPSPPIIGAVQTYLENYFSVGQAWRYSMGMTTMVLVVSAIFMFVGWRCSFSARDYREAEIEQGKVSEEQDVRDPLLDLKVSSTSK